jgi:hypothetical protein
MTKSAEDEVNLTAADGITPILIGTTEALPLRAAEPPGTEALPLTPEPAKEDAIMAEPAQSTPEAGPEEEPFPASTPDSSTDLLDKDGPDDFELNYNGTSSDENVGGRDEEGSAPQEEIVAGADPNTPEGTMTPPSSADTTPQDVFNNQLTAIRQLPIQINPPGQTDALNPNQTERENPSQIESPFNPSGLSTLQWKKQKQVSGRMLEGYKSSGGSPINLEAVMMVAFNQLEGNDQVNIMAQSQTRFSYQRQQKEIEEQSTIIRESTARVLAAQEELIREALKAKDSLRAQMSSPNGKEEDGSEVHQLLVKLEKVSAELLEEKKHSLELCRELAAEKQQNKQVRTGMIELDKTGVNLGSSSTLQTQLRIQSTRSEGEQASSISTLPLSRKFTQVQTAQGQIQPTSTSSTQTYAAMHTLQFGRPPTAVYPTSIIATQRFNRTEQQVDLSVRHWKQALQR